MARKRSRSAGKARASAPRSASLRTTPSCGAGQPFDLDRFERLAFARHGEGIEEAFDRLLKLLEAMERGRGDLPDGLVSSRVPGGDATPELDRLNLVWTRMAHAVSALFLNPRLEALNWEGFEKLLLVQRQLGTLFHASSLETSDAALLAFNISSDPGTLTVKKDDLYKVLLLYSLESHYDFRMITNFEAADRAAVLFTCIALCSTPFCGSERSYKRRNELLRYLCRQLNEHPLSEPSLYLLTVTGYMTCSYADDPDKHVIKGLIHQQWRRLLAAQCISDLASTPVSSKPGEKPTLLILHEWLRSGTAMHRCYAKWIRSLSQRFHTVGMGLKDSTQMDPEALSLFDAYVPLPEGASCIDQVRVAHTWCRRHRPAIVYYPSVGMGGHTVAAASIRLAPIQIITPGHPASTGSPCMDVMVVSEDHTHYKGTSLLDETQLTERLLYLPANSMSWSRPPWLETDDAHGGGNPERYVGSASQTTQVIISASPMKLGFPFLQFIAEVNEQVKPHAFWHFFIADSRGALHLEIKAAIRSYLGEFCHVYPHLNYPDYSRAIQIGHIFLSPFPFGNANTIYDYFSAKLVGSCLISSELQSPDAVLLGKLGFPDELIAQNLDAYKEIAIKLITNPEWREHLRSQIHKPLSGKQRDSPWQNDPSAFADHVYSLLPSERHE